MPKSYKITQSITFEKTAFSKEPISMNQQRSFEGIPAEPQTKIFTARDQITHDDFVKYMIEHEMEEVACGRINNSFFEKYIRKEVITAFHGEKENMLLLSGKKRFVLDFCRKTKDLNYIKIETFQVDMPALLSKLPHVKGVWFRFKQGLVRASALMGTNLEATPDFQKFKDEGDISTLSFLYEFTGGMHPIMVTDDGTIVLYHSYREISDEIDIVMDIHKNLLADIANIVNTEKAKEKS